MLNWENVLAAQRMQTYIETHLKESITMHELARAAGYSPWHSARIFKLATGLAPFEYIRGLRLSHAANTLKEHEELRIIDVAFDFVFDSHEGFTRAFTKQFGLTPHCWQKTNALIRPFLPPSAYEYYRRKQKGETDMQNKDCTVFVQVVQRPARKLILKRGKAAAHYFDYCDEVGCDIWDTLCAIKDALYEPIGMWLPDTLRPEGTSLYAQGVEMPADYEGSVPDGFELITLPPCKMMIFQGPPYEDAKFEGAIESLWDVMKRYDPRLYGFEWADDDGPRFQLAPMSYRGYIEARPVRELNQ